MSEQPQLSRFMNQYCAVALPESSGPWISAQGDPLVALFERRLARDIEQWSASTFRNFQMHIDYSINRRSQPNVDPAAHHRTVIFMQSTFTVLFEQTYEFLLAGTTPGFGALPPAVAALRCGVDGIIPMISIRVLSYRSRPGHDQQLLSRRRTLHDTLTALRNSAWIDAKIRRLDLHTWRTVSQWWKVTGKPFNLFALPAEVREQIYLYACGWVIGRDPLEVPRHKEALNLLLTCKAVAAHARQAVFRRSCFYFSRLCAAQRLFRPPQTPLCNITYLELAFTHYEFLRFFGAKAVDLRSFQSEMVTQRQLQEPWWTDHYMHTTQELTQWDQQHASIIRRMRLRSLVLRLPCPDMTTIHMGIGTWVQCPGALIKLVLETAWNHVAGQPVILTGYIRPEDKAIYEDSAALAWRERARWEQIRSAMGLPYGNGDDGWDNALDGGVQLDEMALERRGIRLGKRREAPSPVIAYLPAPFQVAAGGALWTRCRCDPPCNDGRAWKYIHSSHSIVRKTIHNADWMS